MIYLVHGENIADVERQVVALRQKVNRPRVIRYDGRKFNRDVWQTFYQQTSLFLEAKPLLIIGNSQAIHLDTWQHFFHDFTPGDIGNIDIIFVSYQQLRNIKVLSYFPRENVFLCRPAITIFSLLESIGKPPTNPLRFLSQLFLKMPPQLIIYWLKRYFHELYWLNYGQTQKAGWQLNKQRQHLNKLGWRRVRFWYRSLLWLDYQQKTGHLPEGLEIALVNLFLRDYYENNGKE